MSNRKVHKDKIGLYIKDKKRRYRPTGSTVAKEGERVYAHLVYQDPDRMKVRESSYMPDGSHKLMPDGKHKAYDHLWKEDWKTTDPVPEPEIKNIDKGAQVNIRRKINGTNLRVVIGEDGFDYNQYKREPDRAHSQICTKGKDLLISMNSACLMTWDDWDDLVRDIDYYRTEVPLRRIRVQVEEHNQLAAEVRKIKEKYEGDEGEATSS